jgi:hypothetical protein
MQVPSGFRRPFLNQEPKVPQKSRSVIYYFSKINVPYIKRSHLADLGTSPLEAAAGFESLGHRLKYFHHDISFLMKLFDIGVCFPNLFKGIPPVYYCLQTSGFNNIFQIQQVIGI